MVSNQAEIDILNEILNDATKAVTARLFQNNPGAADADVTLADLTEADFDGYDGIEPITWDTIASNVDEEAETLSDVLEWERAAGAGGDQTVYGIYLTYTSYDTTDKLLWFARFAAAFDFDDVGVILQKTINWRLRQLIDA